MRSFYVRLANRFGWLYMIPQSEIDWYWFKQELRHLLKRQPHMKLPPIFLQATHGGGYVVTSVIDMILVEANVDWVASVRHDFLWLRELMQDRLSLLTMREAILAAIDIRLGNRIDGIERYLEAMTLNVRLEQKGEPGLSLSSLAAAIFSRANQAAHRKTD